MTLEEEIKKIFSFKKRARILCKYKGITHHEALNEISKKEGYPSYIAYTTDLKLRVGWDEMPSNHSLRQILNSLKEEVA